MEKKAEFITGKSYAPVPTPWKFYLREGFVGCVGAVIGAAIGFFVASNYLAGHWQEPLYCRGQFLCGLSEGLWTLFISGSLGALLGAAVGVIFVGRYYRVQGSLVLTLLCGITGPVSAIISGAVIAGFTGGPLITLVIGVIVTGFGAAAGYNIRARVKG